MLRYTPSVLPIVVQTPARQTETTELILLFNLIEIESFVTPVEQRQVKSGL